MKTNFYYNHYNFEEDKKYLIFFRGCFACPTAGHFSLVDMYADLPNVTYYISQIGSESRHGVTYELNRKIWKIYIQKLLDPSKIILKKAYGMEDVLDEIEGIDVVIFLRGNEEEVLTNREKEIDRLRKYKSLLKTIQKKGIQTDFLIVDRPEKNTLSASKFVEAILRGDSSRRLKFFLPPKLEDRDAKYIIRKLREQNLK